MPALETERGVGVRHRMYHLRERERAKTECESLKRIRKNVQGKVSER